jgi:hypothetical protein
MLQMNEWDFRRQGGREQDLEIWKSRIAGITVTSDRGRRRHQANLENYPGVEVDLFLGFGESPAQCSTSDYSLIT